LDELAKENSDQIDYVSVAKELVNVKADTLEKKEAKDLYNAIKDATFVKAAGDLYKEGHGVHAAQIPTLPT
jgi:hypothetical protein